MIDQIVNASRASFIKEPNAFAYRHFEDLMNFACNLHPDISKPSLRICYSLNRICETLKFQNTQYIVYDQYLGQSFNKMNRILFHEDDNEALAYLCKILSEEFYLINNIDKAIAYNMYYQYSHKAKAENLPKEFLNKKGEIIAIQESLVFFHELAHSIVSNDHMQVKYAEDFIASDKLGRGLIDTIKNNLKHNKKDPNEIRFFYEEAACDFLATNFTYAIFKLQCPVKYADVLTSISSGFLFLRTIYDLKDKAKNLFGHYNTYTFFMKLRYNALRSYFQIFQQESNNVNQIEVYDLWERKFDMNLVLRLTNDFEEDLLKIFKRGKYKMEDNIVKELFGLL